MKIMTDFLFAILVMLLSATIFWISWNQISYLFPLPEKWMHLGFLDSFCLIWLIRSMSAIVRMPDLKASKGTDK